MSKTAKTVETAAQSKPQAESTSLASQAVKPEETPQAQAVEVPVETLPPVEKALLVIPGNKIDLSILNSRLQAVSSNAGRIKAKAIQSGHGRLIKDLSGHGTVIPTISILGDMAKAGLLGETESKEGKARVKAMQDEIKGLNLLIDGLTLLGLASRKA